MVAFAIGYVFTSNIVTLIINDEDLYKYSMYVNVAITGLAIMVMVIQWLI